MSKRKRWAIAGVATALVAGVGVTGGVVLANGKPDASLTQDVDANGNVGPTSTNGADTTDSPTSLPTIAEGTTAIGLPDLISGAAVTGGNIQPGRISDQQATIHVDWQGKSADIPTVQAPEFLLPEDFKVMAEQVLGNYAILCTLDPSSEQYRTLLDTFTTSESVKQYILEKNMKFQAESGKQNYSDQRVIYDTSSDPTTWESLGADNLGIANGKLYPRVTLTSGTVYSRYLNKDAVVGADKNLHIPTQLLDVNSYIPAESKPLPKVYFSYDVDQNGHANIVNLAVTDR